MSDSPIVVPAGRIAASLDGDGDKLQQVSLYSDGDGVSTANPLPVVSHRAPEADSTAVPASSSAVSLLAANDHRHGFSVYNGGSTPMYVKAGSGASIDLYTFKLNVGSYYEPTSPVVYTGEFTAVWEGEPTGAAMVTEYA